MKVDLLETIDIVGCQANIGTCEGLATILRNRDTKLEILNLDDNPIDDACMEILCQSLAHNTSLKTIYLNDIEDYDITAIEGGWELFGKLIFDKTSLESIYH